MKASDTEKVILKSMISSFEGITATKHDAVYAIIWSAESYLYNRMTDLNLEEVAKAKETTNDLEQLLREASKKYEKANEGWERCDKILFSEDTFSQSIWQEAVDNTDEFLDFSKEVMEKCESIRQEMLKNIKNSGVKP